jgi:hypothetical protein
VVGNVAKEIIRGFQSCHYLFPYFVPYSRFGPENDLMVILMAQIMAAWKAPII